MFVLNWITNESQVGPVDDLYMILFFPFVHHIY